MSPRQKRTGRNSNVPRKRRIGEINSGGAEKKEGLMMKRKGFCTEIVLIESPLLWDG
ncbi:hypothetical protein HQ563_17770 [bacterium]|nr:hypothetical protein [bacterium]